MDKLIYQVALVGCMGLFPSMSFAMMGSFGPTLIYELILILIIWPVQIIHSLVVIIMAITGSFVKEKRVRVSNLICKWLYGVGIALILYIIVAQGRIGESYLLFSTLILCGLVAAILPNILWRRYEKISKVDILEKDFR